MTQKIVLLQPIASEMEGIISSLLPEGFSAYAIKGRSTEEVKAGAAATTSAVTGRSHQTQ